MIEGAGPPVPDAKRQISSLPMAIVLLGPDHRIASVNPAAEQFFGQSARYLDDALLTDVLQFDDAHMFELFSDSDMPVSAREVDVRIAGSAQRKIDIAAGPVGDMPGWQIFCLHDHAGMDNLGNASGNLTEPYLRGPEILAHEIKNPLAGIKGAAQLLARKTGEKDQALTQLICSEVDRIATLIEQMQQLSGTTAAPVTPCNLHEIIRMAIAVLEVADGEAVTGFAITEEFDPSLPDVLGNSDHLVQVLINLLSNAREACREQQDHSVVVSTRFFSGIQIHPAGSDKPVRLSVELRISDDGPGVPANLRDHIFEPFVTTKKSGQGLGLALSRKLVHDMNGRVSHERDETRGLTHFRVFLPLAQNGSETGNGAEQ